MTTVWNTFAQPRHPIELTMKREHRVDFHHYLCILSDMNEKVETPEVKNIRSYDVAPPTQFADFMRTGWAPSNLEGLQPLEVVTYAFTRRQVLSAAFANRAENHNTHHRQGIDYLTTLFDCLGHALGSSATAIK